MRICYDDHECRYEFQGLKTVKNNFFVNYNGYFNFPLIKMKDVGKDNSYDDMQQM